MSCVLRWRLLWRAQGLQSRQEAVQDAMELERRPQPDGQAQGIVGAEQPSFTFPGIVSRADRVATPTLLLTPDVTLKRSEG